MEVHHFDCPHCGAGNSIPLDLSGPTQQTFISDCEVCCRPILFELKIQDGQLQDIRITKENN